MPNLVVAHSKCRLLFDAALIDMVEQEYGLTEMISS